MYVCRREELSLDESTSEVVDQWWRLGYVAGNEDAVKTEVSGNPVGPRLRSTDAGSSQRTTLDRVLDVAFTETDGAMLVYATDKALAAEPVALSDALKVSRAGLTERLTRRLC